MAEKVVTRPVTSKSSVAAQENQQRFGLLFPVIAVTSIFVLANLVWSFCDHGMPDWDAAGHVLNGLTYRDLLKHPHLTGDFVYKFLSVNYLYPPGFYILSGCLKLVLGVAPWVNGVVKAFYEALLCVSVYGITTKLLKDKLAAVAAVALINFYPENAFLSTQLMLDFPTLSMVALALWALITWQDKPSLKNTILLGLAIGCACMTKQLAGAFIVVPAGIVFAQTLLAKRFADTGKLIGAAIIPAAMSLPWLIVTYPALHKFTQYNSKSFGQAGESLSFGSSLTTYLEGLPAMMSPLLLLAFIASLLVVGVKTHRALILLSISCLSGFILLSSLSWAYPLDRYAMPALLAPAVYTGAAFSYAWSNRSTFFLRLSYCILAVVATAQYLLFSFSPYPLPVPEVVTRALPSIGIGLRTYHGLYEPSYPDKYDWGQMWVLSQIKQVDKDLPVYLQVLPNSRPFNVHTMEYAAKLAKSPIIATTMRQWAVTGDIMEFSPKTAMYYHWYLLKTGYQGNVFQSDKDQKAFDELTNYVRTSGKFRLIAMRSLPDHSICYLYRQK
ncbi:MAG: glycosyltransferase family 39 protein [Candidatus Obscuribacterales bacterium]|nr:glycosyltransferase family 39 protein [Candidatus Obscuribacterales bacterium]